LEDKGKRGENEIQTLRERNGKRKRERKIYRYIKKEEERK